MLHIVRQVVGRWRRRKGEEGEEMEEEWRRRRGDGGWISEGGLEEEGPYFDGFPAHTLRTVYAAAVWPARSRASVLGVLAGSFVLLFLD